MAKYSNATLEFMKSIAGDLSNDGDLVSIPAKDFRAQFVDDILEKSAYEIKEDINVLELKNILFEKYRDEWLEWYPEVLNRTLFGSDEDSILTNKIQAIRVSYKSDAPWTEWNIFENVGKAFNHQRPNFNMIQPLTLGECLVTGEILSKLRREEAFSGEVFAYVGVVAANENYLYIPNNFRLAKAQKYLDKFTHDHDVRDELKKVWQNIKNKNLLKAEYSEDSLLHQQIGKLAILNQYVKENSYA
jgi:hypothetical protein